MSTVACKCDVHCIFNLLVIAKKKKKKKTLPAKFAIRTNLCSSAHWCLLLSHVKFALINENGTIAGFLNAIFAGICGDKHSTIQMVLPTLLEKVLV